MTLEEEYLLYKNIKQNPEITFSITEEYQSIFPLYSLYHKLNYCQTINDYESIVKLLEENFFLITKYVERIYQRYLQAENFILFGTNNCSKIILDKLTNDKKNIYTYITHSSKEEIINTFDKQKKDILNIHRLPIIVTSNFSESMYLEIFENFENVELIDYEILELYSILKYNAKHVASRNIIGTFYNTIFKLLTSQENNMNLNFYENNFFITLVRNHYFSIFVFYKVWESNYQNIPYLEEKFRFLFTQSKQYKNNFILLKILLFNKTNQNEIQNWIEHSTQYIESSIFLYFYEHLKSLISPTLILEYLKRIFYLNNQNSRIQLDLLYQISLICYSINLSISDYINITNDVDLDFSCFDSQEVGLYKAILMNNAAQNHKTKFLTDCFIFTSHNITPMPPNSNKRKRLKLAVEISGQLRGYEKVWEKVKQQLKDIDYDVYISTWENIGIKSIDSRHANRVLETNLAKAWTEINQALGTTLQKELYKELLDYIENRKSYVTFEDLSLFYETQYIKIDKEDVPFFKAFTNQQKMYYKMYDVHQMVNGDYDLYMRIRPDLQLVINEKINWQKLYEQTNDSILTFRKPWIHRGTIFIDDIFFIGRKEEYERLINTWHSFEEFNRQNIPGNIIEPHTPLSFRSWISNINIQQCNEYFTNNWLLSPKISSKEIYEKLSEKYLARDLEYDQFLINAMKEDIKIDEN